MDIRRCIKKSIAVQVPTKSQIHFLILPHPPPQGYDQFDRIVMELVRVKAWSFARPVIKNNKMAFTDCGAAYLRHGGRFTSKHFIKY